MSEKKGFQDLESWKAELEKVWLDIPKPYRNEHSVRRTLQCHLYGRLCREGERVIADFMPPRLQDRPVDLIVLDRGEQILQAICLDMVVTLAAVKSLSSFEARNKLIITTGLLEKKVRESLFFLKPDIQHLHLQPFDTFKG